MFLTANCSSRYIFLCASLWIFLGSFMDARESFPKTYAHLATVYNTPRFFSKEKHIEGRTEANRIEKKPVSFSDDLSSLVTFLLVVSAPGNQLYLSQPSTTCSLTMLVIPWRVESGELIPPQPPLGMLHSEIYNHRHILFLDSTIVTL